MRIGRGYGDNSSLFWGGMKVTVLKAGVLKFAISTSVALPNETTFAQPISASLSIFWGEVWQLD
jgi:hypothetical protein